MWPRGGRRGDARWDRTRLAGLDAALAVVLIRAATAADAAAIAEIYRPFVDTSRASFEELPPDAKEMARRMIGGDRVYPWLVAEADGAVIGYSSATAFRQRSAYRWTVETGIYVAPQSQRRGIGRALGLKMIEELTRRGYASAVASITLPNPPSVALHERLGYASVGGIRGAGFKLGAWADIGYWQRDLAERRVPPVEPVG